MTHPNTQFAAPIANRLSWRQTWLRILLVLVLHWLTMHWLVTRLGGENRVALAQAPASQRLEATGQVADDGWRRTSNGWEYMMHHPTPATRSKREPSVHVSVLQIWPAAAAACMLLLIIGLPDSRKP